MQQVWRKAQAQLPAVKPKRGLGWAPLVTAGHVE